MAFLGPRFWPPGPQTVEWSIDLALGSFGPIRLGSSEDEVKAALGRPDFPQFFGVQTVLHYQRFGLTIFLDKQNSINNFQIDIPERADKDLDDLMEEIRFTGSLNHALPFENTTNRFDPTIKLPAALGQRLRRLTLADFEHAFGAQGEGDECYREWTRGGVSVYIDLLEDGQTICLLGWTLPEE